MHGRWSSIYDLIGGFIIIGKPYCDVPSTGDIGTHHFMARYIIAPSLNLAILENI